MGVAPLLPRNPPPPHTRCTPQLQGSAVLHTFCRTWLPHILSVIVSSLRPHCVCIRHVLTALSFRKHHNQNRLLTYTTHFLYRSCGPIFDKRKPLPAHFSTDAVRKRQRSAGHTSG